MTDHVLIVVIAVSGFVLQLGGLVILGWQLREARRESQRFWTSTGAVLIRLWQRTEGEDLRP
jgi:hypothetical protein